MFSLSLTFLSSLLFFYLPTTLYFNITLYLSFYLLSFCLFLFKQFYYKFVILSSILCIVFPHKKNSLSLSLFLFLVDFFIYFTCISALGLSFLTNFLNFLESSFGLYDVIHKSLLG